MSVHLRVLMFMLKFVLMFVMYHIFFTVCSAYRTLDYIFVSEQCRVSEAPRVFPTIQANYTGTTLPAVIESSQMITQTVDTAQPSLVWPSDHFIVYATLHI